MEKLSLPVAAVQLIPHRPPMLFVRQLIRREGKEGWVTAELSAVTVREYPEMLIEMLAQAVAAVNGYDARCAGGDVRSGMLVGVNEFSFISCTFESDIFLVRTQTDFEFGAMSIVSGEVYSGDEAIAEKMLGSGVLKVWEASDDEA